MSLKWKVLLFLSLVIIFIFTGVTSYQFVSLSRDFDADRKQIFSLNQRLIDDLVYQSSIRLQQIAGVIPSLHGMHDSLLQANRRLLRTSFNEYWPAMHLDLDIEDIQFYDKSNTLLAAWGWNHAEISNDRSSLKLIEFANQNESPISNITCQFECTQHLATPLLVQGQHAGSVLISVTLADVIVNFIHVSNVDVGIITTAEPLPTTPTNSDNREIVPWRARVIALTNASDTMQVLQGVADQFSVEQMKHTGARFDIEDKVFDLRLLPLSTLGGESDDFIITFDDITQPVADIATAIRNAVWFGVLGLLLSVVVILVVLWRPLSRLRQTAIVLPMLAESAFADARLAISKHSHAGKKYKDEIDYLHESASALSFQLESLEHEVAQRSDKLAEKMSELTRERDFIRSLLDTAHVIIITQTQFGKILLVNQFASALTGYTQQQLMQRNFCELIAVDAAANATTNDASSTLLPELEKIALKQQNNLQHESALLVREGTPRSITWIHTCLDDGASDCGTILSVGLDITERKEAESRLSWMADHDPLTGLFNRRRFQEEFSSIVKTAIRHQRPGALLFLDLDHFKYINDTSGHKMGDTIIQEVSKELANTHRDTDVVARLGGDEFAIAMPEVSKEDACAIAAKLNENLNCMLVPIVDKSYRVSVSIGIALFPEHGSRVQELLAKADMAMYQAKEHGRGGWHLFSEQEHVRERLRAHVMWRQRIEQALKDDQFQLHHQPILDLKTNLISHYEVLLRMVDAQGKLLAPESFVEIAEKTGQIHAIDHWVLIHAINNLQRLIKAGSSVMFAINLSAHAFMDAELLPLLRECIFQSKVPAERLVFEITETAALADFPAACTMMDEIRRMGCKFALDDFGVGFSSFYYLKQLPVDFVKIDGSFIKDLATNADDRILVKAMGEIVRGFGKKTVAEFVQDAETLNLLRSYGITYAQGYHIGQPTSFPLSA